MGEDKNLCKDWKQKAFYNYQINKESVGKSVQI
jgi:hypothetical protein